VPASEADVDYLPLFLDLRGRPVLLVGGGEVAARKAELLLSAGARLTVVAPALGERLAALLARHGGTHRAEGFAPDHIHGFALAIAATDDAAVNLAVGQAGRAANVWVNAVDDPAASSCLMPAIVDRSPIVIAIGSGGASPTLVRRLRAQLEALLPERLGELARRAGAWRERVRLALPDVDRRRRFWDGFFEGELAARLLALPAAGNAQGDAAGDAAVDAQFDAALVAEAATTPRGAVWLIGAGPGDPDLLTLRAQQLLQQCDVVLYDRLVTEAVLARVRRDALRVSVGKEPGHHRTTQARIHELLLDYAGRGLRVARLKGGDPMVFGRGGEEIAAVVAAGIPVVVVPGVTAALGAASAAAMPLTHRGRSQAVVFVTAMGEAAAALDWGHLAAPLQTVVFYMGVSQLASIAERLREQGAPATRPALVMERATQPGQRIVAGTLADIAARAAAAGIGAPALLVVGDVAGYAGVVPAGAAPT
jgi:uroporphyrin-III C-methyltransferase / precorrin-2 dehydrogenase / sirohydrochlorin ferrochelatase